MEKENMKTSMPFGVMFNAYPDSIGHNLADTIDLLKKPELKKAFSLFYILPTLFHSDLDRGFSIIDYDINEELVSNEDLEELRKLEIQFKFDLVLNHLSVGSPQFRDLIENGDQSKFKDFFIDWNEFWESEGKMGPDGNMIPKQEHLNKLFMRKPGLPILQVRFPDGSERPYWNTFYQQIDYNKIDGKDLHHYLGDPDINIKDLDRIAAMVNRLIDKNGTPFPLELKEYADLQDRVKNFLEENRSYLGQMDLNAKSTLVWSFYDETFKKLKSYGAKLIRLDAFAYLHKEPGKYNFFNTPGTWEYLDKLRRLAASHDLILLPEIHAEYGTKLHEEIAAEDFPVYDFFLPTLIINALEKHNGHKLIKWADDLITKKINTVNMLGCHDGIPVLDLKGKQNGDGSEPGLMPDEEIEKTIEQILERGGRVKNLYGPDGKKIAYYQVNATYYSALGEDPAKLLLARAIQLFMPGIPQVWYLDLFAGTNDYEAADNAGTAGHKEINRTNLTMDQIEKRLQWPVVQDQLEMIKMRNTCDAFKGQLTIQSSAAHLLRFEWQHNNNYAILDTNLEEHSFTIKFLDHNGEERNMKFNEKKQTQQ